MDLSLIGNTQLAVNDVPLKNARVAAWPRPCPMGKFALSPRFRRFYACAHSLSITSTLCRTESMLWSCKIPRKTSLHPTNGLVIADVVSMRKIVVRVADYVLMTSR